MRWSKPVGGLAGLLVLLSAVGSLATLGVGPLALGGGSPEYRAAATATVLLVVVLLLVAVAVGSQAGGAESTPYW